MDINKIIELLSPIERAVVPYLNLSVEEIVKNSGMDKVSVIRALTFLENKGLVKLKHERKKIVDLGVNGIYYKKTGMPERKLLAIIEENNYKRLDEIKSISKLSDNEFKASIGVLKRKAIISLSNGKLSIAGKKEELSKKFLEEILLEKLPANLETLKDLDLLAFENLKTRKEIIEIKEEKLVSFELTENGKKIAGTKIASSLIEEVTSEIIKSSSKDLMFRRYDIHAKVPEIHGGKRHFVSEYISNGKKVWLELGFKEMAGKKVVTSFWNFDALFTAQDHPVRELHDTFFLRDIKGDLPKNKEIIKKVKEAHEKGIAGSKGWQYQWKEEEAKKVLLRTHTTVLSAQTLASLKSSDLPAKFFAIGKNFRNETVDWKHGFEFNQTEGIVIDPNANLRNLLGYLKEFAKKMGFNEVKFQPSYFPYTEPSVEGYVFNEERKEWTEVFAAGIFRPEVTVPLLGIDAPVLAWGPGFDRLMMAAYKIKDMREIYSNDLKMLRNIKPMIK